ncbi:MAG: hypothetical protein DMD81_14410 [Candidatus Rokuibacteriota bacterium]|nr:MAG: hypothetical protein DMD81_14410 [Candidatus Rokubacteria bacterium]
MNLEGVRLPSGEGRAGPVTILDGEGRVLRIVPAEEFRQAGTVPSRSTTAVWRRRRPREKTDAISG